MASGYKSMKLYVFPCKRNEVLGRNEGILHICTTERLMACPRFGTSHTPFKRGGEADRKALARASTVMQSNFICWTLLQVVQKKLENCLFICASSQHLGKPANEKCSFQTPQKFRSIAVKGWKEVLKASTLVETRSIHQSLLTRPECLPIFNECSFPVFSSRAVFLTNSLSLCFMLISSFHSRRWKIMLFNL